MFESGVIDFKNAHLCDGEMFVHSATRNSYEGWKISYCNQNLLKLK